MRQCRHKREGIVTNQPEEYDARRAHASRQCCSRPSCVDAAISWVAGRTNETAYWIPDDTREVIAP